MLDDDEDDDDNNEDDDDEGDDRVAWNLLALIANLPISSRMSRTQALHREACATRDARRRRRVAAWESDRR